MSSGDYTKSEQQRLTPFVSNLDKPVFVLKNLPQEVAGALFSRYSRSTKSVRRLLLDEFLESDESGLKRLQAISDDTGVDLDRAQDFFKRILAGYGDDSIGELGGVHIAVEDVSNIASKVLEDARIGLSPLEKSSRYVRFDEQIDGKYRYYRDPEIMKSRHAALYERTNDRLFDTYSSLIEPMITWAERQFPQDAETSDRAYRASIKAKALDSIRGLLPVSTLTNVGIFGNGRAFEYLLTKMFASDLAEMRDLAAAIQAELETVIPSLVARANDAKYGQASIDFLRQTRRALRGFADGELGKVTPETADAQMVTLVDYDREAEVAVIAATLYEYSQLSSDQLRRAAAKLPAKKRAALIKAIADQRTNRRQRPGRGFESTEYDFDFIVNYGAYRDLQRHRMLSQQRQLLTVMHGYEVASQVVAAGYEEQFREAMEEAAAAHRLIAQDFAEQAQYVVPFAYRLRYRMRLTLREAYHLIELRSTPQGHPDYRRVAQQMFREIERVHPLLASAMKFVDLAETDELERLAAEKKTDQKLAKLKQSQ